MIYESCRKISMCSASKNQSTYLKKKILRRKLFIPDNHWEFLKLLEIMAFGLGSRTQDVCSYNCKSTPL